jgi:hypothetical protein
MEVISAVSKAVAKARGQRSASSTDVDFAVKFIAASEALAEIKSAEKSHGERKQ